MGAVSASSREQARHFVLRWLWLDAGLPGYSPRQSKRKEVRPSTCRENAVPADDRTKTTLVSYGGARVRTTLVTPSTLDELREALKAAGSAAVTFRDGGHAFDTQSLNDTLVISLARFAQIAVDRAGRTVTAGAGATWGDILAQTSQVGLVPYVMVTTSHACAAGTLASDSLSRFSPTLGREGRHVESFSLMLMTPPYDVVECSRTQHPDLFRTVIAGLGYVGPVLAVKHRLLEVPTGPGEIIAVATTFEKLEGLETMAARLLLGVQQAHKNAWRTAKDAAEKAASDPLGEARACSVVVFTRWGETGLLATSRYVSVRPDQLHRSVYHSPSSVGSWLLQIAALFPVIRSLGYWIIVKWLYGKPENDVDELAGYTFFEDSNRNLRYLLRRVGFPMGIRQQTFVIPFDPDRPAESEAALSLFLRQARTLLAAKKLSPTLLDVLYVPDEADDAFALSSSRDLPGYAATFTFEKLLSASFPAEERALAELAEVCHSRGGRVSLVKNVSADPATIDRMYAGGIGMMQAARQRTGAAGRVSNAFLRRVLGRLAP
jgi:decaprenylphospho-beta-D-ribofuranose 2-oxidase